MRYLKQSTSVDVGVGPFLDETDGKTAETALTITQPDVRLKKNNGNWAQKAAAQTLTHEENGWYELTLDATDTDTIGVLLVAIHESGALPVWLEFHVLAANVYDSLFGAATDKLDVNVEEWNTTAVPAEHTAGYPVVTIKDGTGTGEINTNAGAVALVDLVTTTTTATTATNVTTVNGLAANVITATSIAADAITAAKIADNAIDAGAIASDAITAAKIATGAITAAKFAAGAIDAAAIATGAIDADALAADAGVEIAAAVWDRVLNAANHNIASSAGRRLRQLDAVAVHSGTAQAGASNSITLDTGASATNEIYGSNLLVITAGTGVGQARVIVEYNGTTKVAIVDRAWETNPDNTSEFQIVADAQADISHHGLAQAGGATSITLSSTASATNDVYVGSQVYLSTSTGSGQTRLITAYNGTTKVATVSPAWAVNPSSSSVYKVIPVGRSIVDSIADGAITAAAIAANAFTAAKFNADCFVAANFAADVTTEFQSGLATAAALTTVDDFLDTEIAAIKAQTDLIPASPAAVGSAMALTSAYDFAKGTTAMTEAYAANAAAPTPVQALFAIHQMLMQFIISGTSYTVRKLNNSTTAFVVTLDSATTPTSAVRT